MASRGGRVSERELEAEERVPGHERSMSKDKGEHVKKLVLAWRTRHIMMMRGN